MKDKIIAKHFHIHYLGNDNQPPMTINYVVVDVDFEKGVSFVKLKQPKDSEEFSAYKLMSVVELMTNTLHDSLKAMTDYCHHVHMMDEAGSDPPLDRSLLN
jgi:hypothetical protein